MWTCNVCGGETDQEFNICWTCRSPRPGTTSAHEVLNRILITTTPTLQDQTIRKYHGPVFGETIMGANVFRDIAASITDLTGGVSTEYTTVLNRGRMLAMRELASAAERLGANAVIGSTFSYDSVRGTMLMICVAGTAVSILETESQ